MEEGDSAGEDLEFAELNVAVMRGIFSDGLLEEAGDLLDASTLLDEGSLASHLFYLFGFEVVLALELGDFGQSLVDVTDLFPQTEEEGVILLVYDLRLAHLLALLWLWFF